MRNAGDSTEHIFLDALCKLLREKRLNLGISQNELANRSGLHRTYISELERGSCNLTVESLSKLANALELSLAELMTEAETSLKSSLSAFMVLLVEDNPADAHLIKLALNRCKVTNHVDHVEDGSEAMSYLQNKGKFQNTAMPDLILLDLNLPKKSGHEVLSEIKKDKKLKNIPIVVLTTSRSDGDIKKAYGLHANSYIAKPVNPDQFQSTIETTVEYWFECAKVRV